MAEHDPIYQQECYNDNLDTVGAPLLVDTEGLIARAGAGDLPCPHCTRPLAAERFELLGAPVIRLYCAGPDCTFEEI